MSTLIQSERCDDIPVIFEWLSQMNIQSLVDQACPPPPGNWQGLGYGAMVVVFLCYVISQQDHRLCAVEPWAMAHQQTLEACSGWNLSPADMSDDRFALVFGLLGENITACEQIEERLSTHLIEAYALPSDVARTDTTSFSVYHQPSAGDASEPELIHYGYSKDHRPDLRQYRYLLSTLDPAGLPLASQTLAGNGSDDEVYVESWHRLRRIIGQGQFVFVADCKASALATRGAIQQQGGVYCLPLAATGQTPEMLKQWVLNRPAEVQSLSLPGPTPEETPLGVGFEMLMGKQWQNPETQAWVQWEERHLVTHSYAVAEKTLKGLRQRLEKADLALAKLAAKPVADACRLQHQAEAVLKRYRLTACFDLEVVPSTLTVAKSRRRPPNPDKACETPAKASFLLTFQPCQTAIDEAKSLAGWRIYVTNATVERLSFSQAIAYYRGQWQNEHGFHRLKRGQLPTLPLYIRTEERIVGLMFVLTLALRLFCLLEFVVRRNLPSTGQGLAGLYEGNPRRQTQRPTTELLLKAFRDITFYRLPDGSTQLTPLNPLQKTILTLMGVAEDIYGFA